MRKLNRRYPYIIGITGTGGCIWITGVQIGVTVASSPDPSRLSPPHREWPGDEARGHW